MENETNQPALCRNGCGFYGNPSTDGMCSKCFKDSVRRKQSSPTASPASTSTSSLTSNITGSNSNSTVHVDGAMAAAASISSLPTVLPSNDNNTTQDRQPCLETEPAGPSDENKEKTKTKRNRCFSCRKKVGLTGFECRCGNVFCGLHRYSDKHDCTFDYKAEGRAKITKDNPVILAEKIQKI